MRDSNNSRAPSSWVLARSIYYDAAVLILVQKYYVFLSRIDTDPSSPMNRILSLSHGPIAKWPAIFQPNNLNENIVCDSLPIVLRRINLEYNENITSRHNYSNSLASSNSANHNQISAIFRDSIASVFFSRVSTITQIFYTIDLPQARLPSNRRSNRL